MQKSEECTTNLKQNKYFPIRHFISGPTVRISQLITTSWLKVCSTYFTHVCFCFVSSLAWTENRELQLQRECYCLNECYCFNDSVVVLVKVLLFE